MDARRGLAGIALLSGLLAASATATLSHALIGLLGNAGIGGHAYVGHAHAAVAPLALLALTAAVALLLRSALRTLRRTHPAHHVTALGQRCGELHPLLPTLVVAAGGFATLLAMEMGEQLTALGHIDGVADALGGNALLGLAIVVVVSALLTIVGLRCARTVLATAVAAVSALISWIRATLCLKNRAATVRSPQYRPDICAPAFTERCFGMRAPPLLALV